MKSLPELRRRLRGEEAQRQRLQRENQSLREQSRCLQREKKRLEQESQSLREECRRLQGRIEEIEREAARQAAPFRRRENRKVPPDKRKKPGRKGGHKGRSRPVPDHVHGDAARLALRDCSKITSCFRIPSFGHLWPGLNREILEVGPAIPAFSLNRARPNLTESWARNSGIYF